MADFSDDFSQWEDLLEAYLDGDLSGDTLRDVEARIAADPAARDDLMRIMAVRGLLEWSMGAESDTRQPECSKMRPSIKRYHSGKLDAAGVGRLSRHLESCEVCRTYYGVLCEQAGSGQGNQPSWRHSRLSKLLLAGGLLGATTLGGLAWFGGDGMPSGTSGEVIPSPSHPRPRLSQWPPFIGSAEDRRIISAHLHSVLASGDEDPVGKLVGAFSEIGDDFVDSIMNCPPALRYRKLCLDQAPESKRTGLVVLLYLLHDRALPEVPHGAAMGHFNSGASALPGFGELLPLFREFAEDPRGDLSFYYTLTYLGYHEQPFDPKAWRARRELARERRFLSSYVYVLSRCIRLGQPEMIEIGLSILRGEGIALGEKHQTTLVAGLLHRGASDSQVFEETMALSLQGATPLVRAVILHRFFVLSTRHAHPRAPEFRQRLLAMHKHEDAAVRRLVARFLSMNARPEDRPIIDAMLSRYEGRTARDLKGPERSEWYSLNNARDR